MPAHSRRGDPQRTITPYKRIAARLSSLRQTQPSLECRLVADYHIMAASRGLRLLPRAAPALLAAGEADDHARSMVSVA